MLSVGRACGDRARVRRLVNDPARAANSFSRNTDFERLKHDLIRIARRPAALTIRAGIASIGVECVNVGKCALTRLKWNIAAYLVVTASIAVGPVPAADAAVDAVRLDGSVQGLGGGVNFNERGGDVNEIFYNQNQLLLRLTGCDYSARVTTDAPDLNGNGAPDTWENGYCDDGAGTPRHWTGSLLGLIEQFANEKFLGATTTVVPLVGPQVAETSRLAENYVDLLLKRVLDADTTTALDYDPATFQYVDLYNPTSTFPTTLACPSGTPLTAGDTNCDGVAGGWEPLPLITGTCIAVPLVGDTCLNLFVANVTETVPFDSTLSIGGVQPYAGSNVPDGALVNNVGGKMVRFDGFDESDPAGGTRIFLAPRANTLQTFDRELDGCDAPEMINDTSAGRRCNNNPWRDDDDGLAFDVVLQNLRVETIFEPAFHNAAIGVSDEVAWPANGGVGNNLRRNIASNITDIVDGDSGTAICPDGTTIDPATDYDPACDLSQYLKATGTVVVPEFRLSFSARPSAIFDGSGLNDPPGLAASVEAVTGGNIDLQVDGLQVDLSTGFQYNLFGGEYCNRADRPQRQGQDYLGIFYDQTDNPSNCDPANPRPGLMSPTFSEEDDSTYLLSEQVSDILIAIRAELDLAFESLFDPTSPPGSFFGPALSFSLDSQIGIPLLDNPFDNPFFALGATISTVTDHVHQVMSLDADPDHPRYVTAMASPRGQDYVQFHDGAPEVLRGSADGEFWTDPWGALLPINAGLGFYWTQNTFTASSPTGTEVASCVTANTAFTGYIDGYGGDPEDDPYVSRPLPNLGLNWTGSGASWPRATANIGALDAPDYDSALLHLKIPNANGRPPFVQPRTLIAENSLDSPSTFPRSVTLDPSATETYALGVAVHQNILSKALYEAVIDGLLCINIDPVGSPGLWGPDGTAPLADTISGLMNTDTFGFFVPFLAQRFPDMPVAMQITPVLKPQDGLFDTSLDSFPSKISTFVGQFSGGGVDLSSDAATQVNPIPRIFTGGLNQFDAVGDRFRGVIETETVKNLWPDLSLAIPHLLLNFFVYDQSAGDPGVRKRAFTLDLGLNVGVQLDVVRGGQPTVLDGNPALANARQPYTGTDFPIGCRRNGPVADIFPCQVTGVQSRLVIQLAGLADPELNAVLVFDETIDNVIDPIDGSAEPVTQIAGPSDAPNDITAYEDAISNLLGMALSGQISAFAEIGLDPAALLDIPFVLTLPYIGPSFVWNDEGAAGPPFAGTGVDVGGDEDLNDALGCGTDANEEVCDDPLLDSAQPVSRDVSDNDLNGFGDYLVATLGLDIEPLEADFLLRAIDSFIEPILYPGCTDPAFPPPRCVSQGSTLNLSSTFDGLLGAPSSASGDGDVQVPPRLQPPQTRILDVRKAHARETLINYEASDAQDPRESLRYSYRVDGGLWTPWVRATTARIGGLLEGEHRFEVRAMDPHRNVEFEPARRTFVVDSVPPTVRLLGDRTQGRTVSLLADVYDAQTNSEDVRIRWRVDEGAWSTTTFAKEVRFEAPQRGQYLVEVEAFDEAGNTGRTALTIAGGGRAANVASGGGCAVAPAASPAAIWWLWGLLGAVWWRRRRARLRAS